MFPKKPIIAVLILLTALPAYSFSWGYLKFWEFFKVKKPNPEYIETLPKKTPKQPKDLPDILLPLPETEKQRLRREKREARNTKSFMSKSKRFSSGKKTRAHNYNYKKISQLKTGPKTFEEYIEKSKDVKRSEFKVPEPKVIQDKSYTKVPEPGLRILKYNDPPGGRDLNLTDLMKNRQSYSPGVLSPDKKYIVYTCAYSYPGTQQVASELFVYDVEGNQSITSALKNAHTSLARLIPLLRAGSDYIRQNEKRTLMLLDWSEDSSKVAVIEKLGALTQGPWKTHLWVYNFTDEKSLPLDSLPEAIRYYWKNKENFDLNDYMWDIFPVGWDALNTDRIIVYAYAFTGTSKPPKFLGTWSVDSSNEHPELMSLTDTDFQVSVNGYMLEFSRE